MSYKKMSTQIVNFGSFKSFMKKVSILLFVITFFVLTASVYADGIKTKVDPEKWKKLTPEQKARFIKQAREAQRTGQGAVEDLNEIIKEANKAKKVCEYVKDGSKGAIKGGLKGGPVGMAKGASKAVIKKAVKEKVKEAIKKSKNKKE